MSQPPDDTLRVEAPHAGRFVLGEALGEGSSGRVVAALDLETGQEVALKRVGPLGPEDRLRVRRECAALGLVNLPGVVRLVAHGVCGDEAWIAMERVRGGHFPRGPWAQVERPALGLLTSLAGLHREGLVHRDLKPANVLVDDRGRTTLVDFGLAWSERLAEDSGRTRLGTVLGSPRYMAPEQLRGDPVRPAADLFAVGVLLHESLSGRPPFPDELAGTAADPRLTQAAPALGPQDGGAPGHVRALILRLLSIHHEDRPSAAEALAALGGAPLPHEEALPWLGSTRRIDELVLGLKAGARIALGGGPGSGRSRLLREVAARLPGALSLGKDVEPFASLSRILPTPPPAHDAGQARRALADALGALDAPLLADEWARVDPETRALLADRPGLLMVVDGEGDLRPDPLDLDALKPLFAGPDRLLHLQEDGARELLRRTGGRPESVLDQLRLWVAEGRLEPTGDGRYQARFEDLRRWSVEPVLPMERAPPALDPAATTLLGWVHLCGEHARLPTLAAAMDRPAWAVELLAERLVGVGAAGWRGEVLVPRSGRPAWSAARVQAAHAALARALPLGVSGRLRHALAGGVLEDLGEQALAEAAAAARRGAPALAVTLLESALPLVDDDAALRAALVRSCLALRTLPALARAKAVARGGEDLCLIELVEATALARAGKGEEASRRLDALGPLADAELEMSRLAAGVEARRRLHPDDEANWIQSLEFAWPVQHDLERTARWRSWLGSARHRQGRTAEAAALHEQAAAREDGTGRLSSLRNAALAWLEEGEPGQAERVAELLIASAAAARHPVYEAEGQWARRSAASRRGGCDVDIDLVDCVECLGQPALLGRVALTEAFMASRSPALAARALALCERATRAFAEASAHLPWRYAAALRESLGGEPMSTSDRAALLAVGDLHPDIVLDAAGLMVLGGHRPEGEAARWRALAARLASRGLDWPRGALSPARALELLGAA